MSRFRIALFLAGLLVVTAALSLWAMGRCPRSNLRILQVAEHVDFCRFEMDEYR